MKERRFFFTVAALLFVIGLLPVGTMIVESFYSHGTLTLSAYRQLLHESDFLQSFQNSFLLAFAVASAATVTGVLLGILFGKTDLLLRNFLTALLLVPLLIPPYILAFAWFSLLGHDGLWGGLLFGFWGSAFVLFCVYLPIPLLMTMLFIRRINPRLEEAARLDCGWRGVVTHISLPLIRPALLFSFVLVLILAFGEFSVANFLRYPIFPTQSFTQFSAFYDFKAATASAMPMVLIASLAILAERFLTPEHVQFNAVQNSYVIPLGRYQIPALLMVLFGVLLIVVLPLGALVYKAAHWQSLLIAWQKGLPSLSRSLVYASVGATVLLSFGFLIAYIIQNRLFAWWKWLDGSIFFLFALPSTVIAIALILFWNRPYTDLIYTTPLIILCGYLAKYLILPAKIIQARLSQIPSSMHEAAQLAGAKWYQIIGYIFLPLSKEALILAWLTGFIFSLRENTITTLVYPPGSDTLPVYIFTQMANGKPEIIAALCLIMIGVTLLPLGIFALLGKGKGL